MRVGPHPGRCSTALLNREPFVCRFRRGPRLRSGVSPPNMWPRDLARLGQGAAAVTASLFREGSVMVRLIALVCALTVGVAACAGASAPTPQIIYVTPTPSAAQAP